MRRGFTLGELVVVVIVVSLLCVFLLSRINNGFCSLKNAKITSCGSNLSQLTKAMYNYTITKVEPEGHFPTAPLGDRWWRLLYDNGEVTDHKAFWCPLREDHGTVDYWGPAVNPNLLGASDAIGCDRPGNHGDDDPDVALNWVAKSGDVHKTPASSPKWARLRQTVKP